MTMSAEMEIIEDSIVGIKDGLIVAVGRNNDQGYAALKAKETINASGCIVMPGLVNTHTHLPMVCFRGMADDLPLMEWLTKHIFPAETRFVNKKMVYDGAMLAMAEMILSGTTTFCDGYFFEDTITEALSATGMRAVVSQGFADFIMPDKSKFRKNDGGSQTFCGTLAVPCADDYTGLFLSLSLYLFSGNTCQRKGSRPRSRYSIPDAFTRK